MPPIDPQHSVRQRLGPGACRNPLVEQLSAWFRENTNLKPLTIRQYAYLSARAHVASSDADALLELAQKMPTRVRTQLQAAWPYYRKFSKDVLGEFAAALPQMDLTGQPTARTRLRVIAGEHLSESPRADARADDWMVRICYLAWRWRMGSSVLARQIRAHLYPTTDGRWFLHPNTSHRQTPVAVHRTDLLVLATLWRDTYGRAPHDGEMLFATRTFDGVVKDATQRQIQRAITEAPLRAASMHAAVYALVERMYPDRAQLLEQIDPVTLNERLPTVEG